MTATRPMHLRLISSTGKVNSDGGASGPEPRQLELPLPDEKSAILIDARATSQEAFHSLLQEIVPKVLFDARVVPRLDLLAGSRQQAFQWFAENGSCYVDLFGRLDVTSLRSVTVNPAIWIDAFIDILKSKKDVEGPYVFIFDNADIRDAAERIVTKALEDYTSNKIKAMRWP